MIFVDTETQAALREGKRTHHKLKLGWACYVRLEKEKVYEEWFRFTSSEDFWRWVDKHVTIKRQLWVVAHNWHFDFFALAGFVHLHRLGYELKRMAVDSARFIMKFKGRKGSLLLVDFGNYFRTSLKEIGKWAGVEKLDIDFNTASEEELSVYCRRDVEVLKAAFLKLLRLWVEGAYGEFKPTAAGSALAAFRHRFYSGGVYRHRVKEVNRLELEAYKGGRTECWFIGKLPRGKYYLVDVNSIYSFVMRNYPYPVRLLHYAVNPPGEKVMEWQERFLLIARVVVEVRKPVVGVKRGKLVFPIGRFEAVLTSPELDLVEKHGKVLKYLEVAVYEPAFIFQAYVDHFYRLKVEAEKRGDKAMRAFAKLLLNSLYGKWGQRIRRWEKWGRVQTPAWEILDVYGSTPRERDVVAVIGYDMYRLSKTEEFSSHSVPAIAAFVSAYARCYLWELIEKAGEDNVYYMDTDSLLVNEAGLQRMKQFIGDWLGGLKIELEMEEGEILAPKHYRFGSRSKAKGLSPRAKKLGENKYADERFLKLRSLLRLGVVDTPVTEEVEKNLKLKYDKGVVTETGRVLPLQLSLPPR
ncbi:MAG: DNA polymerase [Thermofilum sp.]